MVRMGIIHLMSENGEWNILYSNSCIHAQRAPQISNLFAPLTDRKKPKEFPLCMKFKNKQKRFYAR